MAYDLSIIILNYNTSKLLGELLHSVRNAKKTNIKLEIIVVDNASIDNSVTMVGKNFPEVKLITNKNNMGYSQGNNRGVKIASGKYLLFLNSDTKLSKNCLESMINYLETNPQLVAASCKLILLNGSMDPACHRGFPTPWAAFSYFSGLERLFPKSHFFSQYHQGWKDLNNCHEVDAISGAFFMVRKTIIDNLNGFDEQYFMYGEDLDLCFRIKKAGYHIGFNPKVEVIHYKKQSGRQKIVKDQLPHHHEIRKKAKQNFYDTMKIFYDKNYRQQYPFWLRQLVLLGIWLVSRVKE